MAAPKGSIVVTGANGVMGSNIVDHILRRPELAEEYVGVYTVRKAATATSLQNKLKSAPAKHRNQTQDLDLSSLESVKKAAANINRQVRNGELPPIRALILNAGYQEASTITWTNNGMEMTWQVNYLANLVFVLLLLESMDKKDGRVLIVSSWSHDSADERNNMGPDKPFADTKWANLFPSPEALAKGTWSTPEDDASWLSGYRRYAASKLCVTMLQQELAHRVARDPELSSVTVVGLDPGAMPTDLMRRGTFIVRVIIGQILLPLLAPVMVWFQPNGNTRTPWKSAGDVVRACFDISVPKGQPLYLNGTDKLEVAKDAQDQEKRNDLWSYGVEAGGLMKGDTILQEWR